jgi:hypothetical protein
MEPTLVYSLDRDSFLVAVTGHVPTTSEAVSMVDARYAELAALGVAAEAE